MKKAIFLFIFFQILLETTYIALNYRADGLNGIKDAIICLTYAPLPYGVLK